MNNTQMSSQRMIRLSLILVSAILLLISAAIGLYLAVTNFKIADQVAIIS